MWWLKELEDRQNGNGDEENVGEQEDDADVPMGALIVVLAKRH